MQTLVFTFCVVLLYAKIGMIGEYIVTVGGLMVGPIVAANLYVNRDDLRSLQPLMIAVIAPICIYLMHVVVGSTYAIEPQRFILSFGLWAVSAVLIWCSFQKYTVVSTPNVLWSLVFLVVLGAIQYFGSQLFHTDIGYRIVAPILSIDLADTYVMNVQGSFDRAIATYYEPSMFGRVLVTLITILLVQTRSFIRPFGFFALGIVVAQSLGMFVLGAVNAFAFYVGNVRRTLLLALVLGIGVLAGQTLFAGRVDVHEEDVANNSAYIRVVLPLEVIGEILTSYPLGVPIGANKLVVENTLKKNYDFQEDKINNGLYELIMYFGVVALGVIGFCIYRIVGAIRHNQQELALIIVYLLLSTAVSSNYLSIESSLLSYFFIAAMRSAARKNHVVG
jgi:hypothetical protein